ncbi:MAG TPA: hypothetical protein P5563_04165 [Saprospiraceae bacterium]|nr:hypothetical protein [Saprospiraceae bacterium]HRW75072.1 hypothetical protein [Saprospiraceae bacterium]
MRVYYYEFVPFKELGFSFETEEELVQDFTVWCAFYAIGEGIVDASHYELEVIDTININESLSGAQVRGGEDLW